MPWSSLAMRGADLPGHPHKMEEWQKVLIEESLMLNTEDPIETLRL